jgi:tRNA (guanine37-N1)-methyltransferase
MRIDILSLFPGYFVGPFHESMIGRAREHGIIDLHLVDLRDFAEGKHRITDDRVYGGGPGMVLKAEPVARAIRSARQHGEGKRSRVIYLTPQGVPLTAKRCRELAEYEQLILLCGHYEGIDQRVVDAEVDEEISIGDYVLTNGCLASIVIVDAVVRFIPGVIGHDDAAREDSFEEELLDCPHYTRPDVWEGVTVPPILLGGNHAEIAKWRRQQALMKTANVRPDLYQRYREAQDRDEKNQGRQGA